MKEAPVVVGTDLSEPSSAALEWAVEDSIRRKRPLRIVHAVDLAGYLTGPPAAKSFAAPVIVESAYEVAVGGLADALSWVRGRWPHPAVTAHVVSGTPVAVLRDEGRDAVEIVVGHHRRNGVADLLFGSVALALAAETRTPVVVAKRATACPHDDVVVFLEPRPASDALLDYAFRAASAHGVRLRVLRDGSAAGPRLDGWRLRYPEVRVHEQRCDGDALLAASVAARLLVVESRRPRRLARLIRRSACPVAIVPAP
ncbi:universal stress protein [Streptosporangium saharense]|uniref:Nucleotide-binding universal stress UspA family protein n=1 Tax=Streptosporangium saharense TaxID=1706840 RepID=A0A7W7QL66_9ACTN|nr:universal stress protein [Streptosporangium saharense]MBB4915439.1 nucleotide-binding universal stress UspA family protein [Streptosporangium saharense]